MTNVEDDAQGSSKVKKERHVKCAEESESNDNKEDMPFDVESFSMLRHCLFQSHLLATIL